MKKTFFIILQIALLAASSLNSQAQSVLVDRGVRVDGLWCFPQITDTLSYLYLPDEGSISLNPEGLPEFSFLRYVINVDNEDQQADVITKAAGGALLHFLVQYDTDEDRLWRAEFELKRKLDNKEVKIKGPVLFEAGRYVIVSSVLNKESGKEEKKLLTMGEAPVLAGGKLAFAFQLNPEDSKLLLESFKMATPDISVMFDLTFSGWTDAFNAELVVNWSEIYDYSRKREKHDYLFYSMEVDTIIENFDRNNTIKIVKMGEDATMEGLIDVAYERLTKMLFEPVDLKQFRDKPSITNQIGNVIASIIDPLGLRNLGSHYVYKMKRIKKEGTTRISLNSRTSSTRHHFITFNIGNLYELYGEDERIFKTVNLFDPDFLQREVYVGLDGSLANEFDKMVDNVTVKFKKTHKTGYTTIDEKLFNRETLGDKMPKFIYGYRKDTDQLDWLEYYFQTIWHFKGGATYQSEWQRSSAAMVNLFSPFEYREIYVDGDLGKFTELGIRAAVLTLEYSFFDKPVKEKKVIRIKDNLDEPLFHQTIPTGQFEYKYNLEWVTPSGSVKENKTDNTGIIFIDPPINWEKKLNDSNEED